MPRFGTLPFGSAGKPVDQSNGISYPEGGSPRRGKAEVGAFARNPAEAQRI